MNHTGIDKYDKDAIKSFLSYYTPREIKSAEAVIALGQQGSGKSTAIAVMLGAGLKEVGPGRYEVAYCPVVSPQSSHEMISKTLNVTPYYTSNKQTVFLDTAGLDEDRSESHALWAKNCLGVTFSLIDKLKATMVVIDHQKDGLSMRAKGFRDLAKEISKVVQRSDEYFKTMVFVVNRAYVDGTRVSHRAIMEKAKEYRRVELRKYERYIDSLLRSYKMETSRLRTVFESMHNTANRITDSSEMRIMRKVASLDMSKVPADEVAELLVLQTSVRLIDTFLEGNGKRVMLYYPSDDLSGDLFRKTMNEKIAQVSTLNRHALNTAMSKQVFDRFDFCEVLSSISGSYLPDLVETNSQFKSLSDMFSRNEVILTAIERDWQKVKEEELAKIRRLTDKKEAKLKEYDIEISRLESSTSLVPIEKRKIVREKSSRFFSWTLLGGGWAEEMFNYSKNQSYHSWNIEPQSQGSMNSKSPSEDNPDGGKLSVLLHSSSGKDLNGNVKVQVYEKDHPSTVSRIGTIREHISRLENDIEELRQKRIAVLTTNTADQLREQLLNEATELAKGCDHLVSKFTAKVDYEDINEPDCPVEERQSHALLGLYTLLDFLKKKQLFDRALPPASISNINELVTNYEAIRTVCSVARMQKYAKSSIDKVLVEHLTNHNQQRPPISRTTVSSVLSFFNRNKSDQQTYTAWLKQLSSTSTGKYINQHQSQLGLCVALLGYLLWCDSDNNNDRKFCFQSSMFIFLTVIGTYIVLSKLFDNAASKTAGLRSTTERYAQRFFNCIEGPVKDITNNVELASKVACSGIQEVTKSARTNMEEIKDNARINLDLSGVNRLDASPTLIRF